MPRHPVTGDQQRLQSVAVAAAGVTALLALTVYLNTLDNPFVFDDFTEVVQNASLRDPSNVKALLLRFPTRPLTNLLYLAGYRATGLNPLAYHAISVVLHTTNVVLLFALVQALWRARADRRSLPTTGVVVAFATASLFAVHPLMTEAVGYTSSQSELLYSTFFLSSLLCFVRALTNRGGGRALGAVLFALGLVSKETTAMLPLVLVACDWAILDGTAEARRERVRRVHAPLFIVVIMLGLARVWLYLAVEHPAASGVQWASVGLELNVMFRYAGLLLWPFGQTIMQPVVAMGSLLDWRVAAALGLLTVVVVLAARYRRQEPIVSFGLAWFFLLLVPSAALIVISNIGQPMAEHRAYLAGAGLMMGIGALTGRAWELLPSPQRGVTVFGGLAVVVAILGTLTVARNRVWDDPVLLWEEAARRSPGAWMAHYGLADAYRTAGKGEAAVMAFEQVLVLSPDNADAYPPLADTLIALKRYDRARAVLRAGLERVPSSLHLRQLLAVLDAGPTL